MIKEGIKTSNEGFSRKKEENLFLFFQPKVITFSAILFIPNH